MFYTDTPLRKGHDISWSEGVWRLYCLAISFKIYQTKEASGIILILVSDQINVPVRFLTFVKKTLINVLWLFFKRENYF